MSAQQTRDAQCLHRLRRKCVAMLQRDNLARRSVDAEAHLEDSLMSICSLNSTLENQCDRIMKSLKNTASVGQEAEFFEPIYRALIVLKGQTAFDGKPYEIRVQVYSLLTLTTKVEYIFSLLLSILIFTSLIFSKIK